MLNIHIFTSGKGNYDTFKKTLKHYTGISKLFILGDGEIDSDIKVSQKKVKDLCDVFAIDYKAVRYDENDFEDQISKIMEIRKTHPDAKLFFNITGGKKTDALIAFISSLWVDGVAYYWQWQSSEEQDNKIIPPIEFPIPKIPVNELAKNKLHIKILEKLKEKKGNLSQSFMREKLRKTNPNNNRLLSPQTLSQSLFHLKKYGLIEIYPNPDNKRESVIEITLSGKIAYSMISQ